MIYEYLLVLEAIKLPKECMMLLLTADMQDVTGVGEDEES